MLYTLISDHNTYLGAVIDSDYVASVVGGLRGDRREDRIDMNHQPRSWMGVFPDPLKVNFTRFSKGDENKAIPDIGEFQGRLFLNTDAYKVLEPFLKNDGEFLSARYEGGDGYIFTPLQVAEIDKGVTVKNEWDEITNIGFIEDQVKGWSVFRTEYNGYMRLYCQQHVKEAIESAGLKGLYVTPDLANIFPEERGDVSMLDG